MLQRDILAFQLLADDDDDLILLANEGLKDLAQLGCERFAKTWSYLVKFMHFF